MVSGNDGGATKTADEEWGQVMADTVQTAIYALGVDVSGYQRGMQAAAQASEQFAAAAAKTVTQTEAVTRATLTTASGYDRLMARFDPVLKANLEYQRIQQQMKRHLDEGAVSIDRYSQDMLKLSAAHAATIGNLGKLNGGLATSGQGFKIFGQQTSLAAYQVTNAGQQFVDVFVGLAGGQRPLTVLIQQLPQLTFALGGMAAALETTKIAAVGLFKFLATTPLGLAVTGVTALATAYLALRDSTDYAAKAEEQYKSVQDITKNNLIDTQKSVYDLRDAYDKLTEAQRRSEAIDLSAAIRKNDEYQSSLKKAAEQKIPQIGIGGGLNPFNFGENSKILAHQTELNFTRLAFNKNKDVTQLKLGLEDAGFHDRAASLGEYEKKLNEAEEAGKKFQAQLRLLNGMETEQDYITLQTTKDISDSTSAREKHSREVERAAEIIRKANQGYAEHIKSLQDERYQLTLNERERYIYNELLKEEQRQKQAGLSLSAARIEQLRQEAAATYDVNKAADENRERLKKLEQQRLHDIEQQQRELERVVDRTTDKLTDSFFDFFEQGKSGWKGLKDYAISMLKEMAAASIIRPIIQPIVGNALNGVGGASTPGTSFGGAASGGSIFDRALGFGQSAYSSLSNGIGNFGAFGTTVNSIGTHLGFGSGLQAAAPSTSFVGPMPLASGSLFGTATLGNALGAGGIGFSAGGLLNSLAGGNSQNGMIGGALGGLAGLGIGSALGGTVLGMAAGPFGALVGALGGQLLGGLFGPKKSVGPNANANLTLAGGRFGLGSVGADNGADPSGVAGATAEVAQKLNEALDKYGFIVNSGLADWTNTTGNFGINTGAGSIAGTSKTQDDAFIKALRGVGYGGKKYDLINTGGGAYDTVLKNSAATTADALIKDLDLAKFIEDAKAGAAALSDVQKQFKKMTKQADDYIAQAARLGIATKDVTDALIGQFNKSISDGILKIANPMQAALEAFDRDAQARLDYATKIGADLVQVEKLTGLERQRILEQSAQQSASDLRKWLDAQKLGATSSLSPVEKMRAAQTQFDDLASKARAGGGTAGLTGAADQLLGLSRDVLGGAGADYAQRESSLRALIENIGKQQGLPGFATGGSFMVGGAGGTDSQLVAFRATPNERVIIQTPSQQGGSDDVVRGLGQQTAVISDRLDSLSSQVADLAQAIRIQNATRKVA